MVLSYLPYKVGGALTWNDPSYIHRQADLDLLQAIEQDKFAYVLGARQLGKSDAEQLEYANSQKSAIPTHNRIDFENLARDYFDTGKSHSGIIIAVRKLYTEIVRRLLIIWDSTTADEMENQILYI